MKDRRFIVVGAGHFGKRACLHLKRDPKRHVVAIDLDNSNAVWAEKWGIEFVNNDGISFLADPDFEIRPHDYIIPALPVHLAAYWLIANRSKELSLKLASIPTEVINQIPNPFTLPDGSCVTSNANFLCPEDCKEGPICPVTGQKRATPLYKLLSKIKSPQPVHLIRSRQLGPGMGGYKMEELQRLMSLPFNRHSSIIIATACSCHGILTRIQIE